MNYQRKVYMIWPKEVFVSCRNLVLIYQIHTLGSQQDLCILLRSVQFLYVYGYMLRETYGPRNMKFHAKRCLDWNWILPPRCSFPSYETRACINAILRSGGKSGGEGSYVRCGQQREKRYPWFPCWSILLKNHCPVFASSIASSLKELQQPESVAMEISS